jgi:hypothetical protein
LGNRTPARPDPGEQHQGQHGPSPGNLGEDVAVGAFDNGGHDRAIAPCQLTVGSEVGATKDCGRCSPNQVVPYADP